MFTNFINEIYSIKMNSSLFQVSLAEVKGAVVSGIIAASLAIFGYILSVGDIFKLNSHDLINAGAIAAIVACTSYIKSALTNSNGTFAGIVQVR